MTIQIGEQIPNVAVKVVSAASPARSAYTHELFGEGRSLVFGVPGAFTPTCSQTHLPSYVQNLDALRERGIRKIFCLSVNDPFVLQAWAKALHIPEDIEFIADGNCILTDALGLDFDASGYAMGERCRRFAMVLEGDTVEKLVIEKTPGACDASAADQLLSANLV